MAEDLVAMPRIAPAPAGGDYDAICAALMQTERGRWFLEEYALRNRSADTKLLLSAVGRIEAAVCTEHGRQVQNGFRTDLLEMARAITLTQAEVAAIRPEAQAAATGRAPDVFAAAERIRDVTWAMRGHGFDPSTCDQLEELAGTILSASALRDPTDHRAYKLGEVLQYLERRISGLLDNCAESPAAPNHDHGRNGKAITPAHLAETRNGSAGPLLMPEPASDADERPQAGSLPIRVQGFLAVHDDLGRGSLPSAEALPGHTTNGHASLPAAFPPPDPQTSNDPALAEPLEHDPEKWTPVFGKRSCSTKDVERDDDSKKSHPALAAADPPINGATLSKVTAHEILPEIELPDFSAAAPEGLPPIEAASLPEVTVPEPAPPAPAQIPSAPMAPIPTKQLTPAQPPAGDPLAALKAMTEEELVALFT